MSKKYKIEKIYAKAMKLLDAHQEIVFESILVNCLGVSKTWFYDTLMENDEYRETIKERISENCGKGTIKALEDMNASDAPACIISRAKIMNEDLRNALNDKEEATASPNIVVNIGGEAEVEIKNEDERE